MLEERREGRKRLQKLAALVMWRDMCAVPTAPYLPQTPTAALALGVLASWHSHCQVCSSHTCAWCSQHWPCSLQSCHLIQHGPQRADTASYNIALPAILLPHVDLAGAVETRQAADGYHLHAACSCLA